MRLSRERQLLRTALLIASALPLKASTTMPPRPLLPTSHVHVQNLPDANLVLESLRRDVVNHPNDFMTFETQAGANRFITEHGDQVYRETERKAIQRGIVGYWRGKTLVVLPSLSAADSR